jgi:hypothetical protein
MEGIEKRPMRLQRLIKGHGMALLDKHAVKRDCPYLFKYPNKTIGFYHLPTLLVTAEVHM